MIYDHGETIPLIDTIESKAIREDDDCFIISGYASTFGGDPDRAGDIVMPGAFKKSLEADGLPQFLWNHNQTECPIGAIVDCHENKRGLWFKGILPRDDQFVRGRVIPQLRMKGLKGVSIGYKVVEKEQRRDARYLKQIKLYEISLTSMPANPLAEVEFVSKSFTPAAHDVVERTLDEVARELWSLARRGK
jgi:HK97 family phage prohead protease